MWQTGVALCGISRIVSLVAGITGGGPDRDRAGAPVSHNLTQRIPIILTQGVLRIVTRHS